MLPGQVYSPASPFQGAAYSAYGYKPAASVLSFSVGDQAATDDAYITKTPTGDLPTATIDSGVLTFSHPQTHSYIGIGDKVSWSGGSVYLSKKITTRVWEVKNPDGSIPDDETVAVIVTSINKVFSTVIEAINGAGSDAEILIGSGDLVDLDIILQIACYTKASNNSDAIALSGWTKSTTNFIKIFAPNDISTECNSTQRHGTTFGGFFIYSNAAVSTLITIDDNVVVDGLCIKEDGACNIGINAQGGGIISNCMINGFATHGIKVTEASDDVQVISNILYGTAGIGIAASASTRQVNNTVYGYLTGYEFTAPGAGTYCAGCIAASNATLGFTVTKPTLYNCSSDDASAGASNGCVSSITTLFYDAASGDFRLTNANDVRKIATGIDLRTVGPYFVTRDAAGTLADDTPSMGALHLIRSVPTAIGDTGTDIKTGAPNMSISGGVITFSIAQINDLLSAGCEVMPGNITLLEKISTTEWRSTLDTGLAPADDAGPTAITSIKPKFDSLFASTPASLDLVANDTAWKVLFVGVTGTSETDTTLPAITSDETRDIQIYAPAAGSECNSRRRHSGVWNDGLVYIERIIADDVGYITIRGIQVGTDVTKDGIDSYNAKSVIEECIIKEAAKGILVKSGLNLNAEVSVLNNVIYDCDDEGIKIENTNTDTEVKWAIYNNTIYNCLYGISFDGISGVNHNTIRLVNNLCLSNQKDIVGDSPRRLDMMSSESNFTSDVTAFALDSGRNNIAFVRVSFIGLRNFHIPLAEHMAMTTSYAASADQFYQNYSDIDGETRPVNSQWSIGADQYSIPTASTVIYSVGLSTADLQNDTGMVVSVSGSIATFAESLNAAIGVGDKVEFEGASDPVYLAEKGSSTVWRVVDNDGVTVSDFSDTLDTIKRVSNSLSVAFSADIAAELGSKDLVAKTAALKVECYQDGSLADSIATAISGWTTSLAYPITIETPFDTATQCGRRQRHIGVWSNSYYHMELTGDIITINNDYVYIDGIQMDPDGNKGIVFTSSAEGRAERCLIRNASTGIEQSAAGFDVRVNANTIYDPATYGVDLKQGTGNNNTIVGDLGTLFNTAAAVTLTNNVAQGAAANYSVLGTRASCISEDATGTTGKISVVLDFSGTNDYHLARGDFEAINYGVSDSNNPDRDVDSEYLDDISIGSHCPVLDTIDQIFSCGISTNSFSSSLLTVTIAGSIAQFSDNVEDASVMAGDKMLYDFDSKVAYLKRKISDLSWEVVDELGASPTAVSAKSVVSIKRTFNSLVDIFDVSSADSIAQFYGDSTNPFTALDRGKMKIRIAVAKDGEFGPPVDANGFTADAENHFVIFAPVEGELANSRHKHEGIYAVGRSALRWDNSSPTTPDELLIQIPYTEVNGLVVIASYSAAGRNCINLNAVGCTIVNNILFDGKNGILSSSTMLGSIIANNIIYHCYIGIFTSTNDYILNNTVDDIDSIGISDGASDILINNIVQDCGTACYLIGSSLYCMSDDASVSGTGSLPSTSAEFKAVGVRDYSLTVSSPRGVGFQLVDYSAYPFSTDAVETTRGRFWDMGALEYQATRVVYYSVGNATGIETVGSSTLKLFVSDGIGVFVDLPQISSKLMSGDVVSTDVIPIHLAEKISNTTWRVTKADGSAVPSPVYYNVSSIDRAFSTLFYLYYNIYAILGTDNLPSIETQVNITIADDSVSFASGGSLSFISDADYFLKIFAPVNVAKHCNARQQHQGTPDEGASLNVQSGQFAIRVQDTNFFEMSGVIVSNDSPTGVGIQLDRCIGFVLDSNFVRNCQGGGISCEVDSGALTGKNCAVFNNIVSRCKAFGIKIIGADYEPNIVWVMNNTVVSCGSGLHHMKDASGGAIVKVYNNILQRSLYGDLVEDHVENTGKFFSYRNITEDGSAGGLEHNLDHIRLTFTDADNEMYELDPDYDSEAIDSGEDMQTVSPVHFDTDARDIQRESFFWDRGALERNENIGSGTLNLGPLEIINDLGLMVDSVDTVTIYLRESSTDRAPLHLQFDVGDPNYASFDLVKGIPLDEYLAWNDIDNIIIYIEGGVKFEGTLPLSDRGSAWVRVESDPFEIKDKGAASIVYTDWIVDNASKQSYVRFENLKVYSDDAQTKDYLISSAALTEKMIFVNSIVQANKDAMIDNASCRIEMINCINLYFNEDDSAILYLAKNALTGHVHFNNILLAESANAESFQVNNGVLNDYVNNCITFNISTGSFAINALGRKNDCMEDEDPFLTEVESGWIAETVSVIMTQSNFTPLFESPVVNSGNDGPEWLAYGIEIDIIGNDRTFQFEGVDIGPYELEIHIIDICGADIKSVDQVKVEIDRINRRLVSLVNDIVYTGLWQRFQYDQKAMEEFVREEKIAIVLKSSDPTYALKSDKVNELLAEFEAKYDSPTKTIVVAKLGAETSRRLGQIMEDDTYVLHFNEQESKLYLYLNEAPRYGMCGTSNPIKNVRFGGNPTFSG